MAISFKKENGAVVKKVNRKKVQTPQEIAKEEIMKKVATFTADQLKAFNILIDKNNPFVFLTGAAGTGKSYALTTAIDYLRRVENEWVAVTATTATAALLIEATTVHKFFGFKPDILIDERGKPCARATKKIFKCSVVVIDEASMMRCDLLSAVVASIKKANKKRAKEGLSPMRLILCGDPCQLPSIMTDTDKEELEARLDYNVGEGFFFDAKEWNECNFKCIELHEVMRQKGNTEFIENLNRIRLGDGSNTHWFNNNCSLAVDNPPANVVSLFPYNKQVRAYNKKRLSEMDGEEVVYTAELEGLTAEDVEDNGYDYELRLKQGCLVMIKQNPYSGAEWCEMLCSGIDSADYVNYFCNGSVGIYRGSYEDVKGEYLAIELQDKGNHFVKIYRKTFDTYDYAEVNGRLKKVKSGKYFRTFPLVLSFAISVHKSQGASLPAVMLDPKSFASGMLYVGLSRVKGDAKKIYLTRMIEPHFAILSDEVKAFLERIRKEDEEDIIREDLFDVYGEDV